MFFSFNSNANKTKDEYYEVVSYFDREVKQYSLNLSSGRLVYTLKARRRRGLTVERGTLRQRSRQCRIQQSTRTNRSSRITSRFVPVLDIEILPLLFSTLIVAAIIIWFMRRRNNIMGDAQRGMG